ncbi:MAG TPA: hypothetical protein VJV03_02410 [Pyrinomonadaceae bacterium]|nr:hypothetical protein [Pyrinomonadaceae bacterium]
MRRTFSFALTISIFILALASPTVACLGPPPLSPTALVTRADVIVRATALRYVKTPREEMVELDFSSSGNIQFKVEEILKGERVAATLMIEGLLTVVDDFNDGLVPYHLVRRGGRHVSCEVYSYKKDAEFLLFLRKEEGKLTPYWASMSPTNEQLRSPDDAWVKWVREYLRRQQKRESSFHGAVNERSCFAGPRSFGRLNLTVPCS